MCRLGRLGVLTLALAGLALLPGACGSGATGESSPASRTYTNDQYGFTMTYDGQFAEGETKASSPSGDGTVFEVVFPDKNGPTVGGKYTNALRISVYKLANVVKPDQLPKLKKELSGAVTEYVVSLSGGKIDRPLEDVTVNGIPGFSLDYGFTEDDATLKTVDYFLYKGHYQYTLEGMAASQDWEALKGKLEAAFQTFTAK
jgi:hypothetical protein